MTIDLLKYKSGYRPMKTETGFNIEVIHPVHGYNMCETLGTKKGNLKKVKFEIENATSTFRDKNDPIESLKVIFEK